MSQLFHKEIVCQFCDFDYITVGNVIGAQKTIGSGNVIATDVTVGDLQTNDGVKEFIQFKVGCPNCSRTEDNSVLR